VEIDNFADNNDNNRDRVTVLRDILMQESGDSISLINDLENNPICSITFDASVPCIAVQWRGYATSAQMRFVLENIICLLDRHKAHRILGDDTLLPLVHSADQQWIINDWYPRAIAAGWRVSANKVPKNYFGQLTTNNVQAEVPGAVVIRPFEELEEARQWLKGFLVE
jgi:predicted lipoprotein